MTQIVEKEMDLIKISLLQFSLLLLCYLLNFFLSVLFSIIIFTTSKIPDNIQIYSESEKQALIKSIESDLTAIAKTSPADLEKLSFKTIFVESPSLLLLNSFFWILSFILPGYFFFKYLLKENLNYLTDDLNLAKLFTGFKIGMLIAFTMLLVSIVFKVIGYNPAVGNFQRQLFIQLKGNYYLLAWSIYTVALITGIIEELFFRGFLLTQFNIHGYKKEGLFLTSAIFGYFHYSADASILVPIVTGFIGLAFGYAYLESKNLWVSISAHVTYNSILLISGYFLGDPIL